MKRVVFRVVLLALVALACEGGALLLEKVFPVLPGPYRAKGPPFAAPFAPGQRVSHLEKVSVVNDGGYFGRYYPPARTPGTYRIVLLGDSMGFGFGVDQEKAFPIMLEDDLNGRAAAAEAGGRKTPHRRYEVLNFSAPGYDTFLETERYMLSAERFAPDHVIVAYFPNDAAIDRFTPNAWRVCPVRSRKLDRVVGVAIEYSGLLRVVHDVWKRAHTGYPGVVTGHPNLVNPNHFGFQCAMYWLGTLRSRLDANGVKLSIVQIPYLAATEKTWDPERHVQEYLERWFTYYGYATVNLYPAVAGRDPSTLLLLPDQHPNELGHRLFAEYLFLNLGRLGIPLPD
jgi:hypothetical protein